MEVCSRRQEPRSTINGDSLSQWDKVNFDPSQNQDLLTDSKIFVTVDYVPETTPMRNFLQICPRRASRQIGEI